MGDSNTWAGNATKVSYLATFATWWFFICVRTSFKNVFDFVFIFQVCVNDWRMVGGFLWRLWKIIVIVGWSVRLTVYLIGFGNILVLTFSSDVESIGNSTLSSDGMYRKLRELSFSIERECLARLLTSGTDDFTKWCDTFLGCLLLCFSFRPFCCIFSVTSLSASQRVTWRTLCSRVTWATCARYTWRWCRDDWNLGIWWLPLPFLMGATLEYLHPLIRFCSFRTKILQRTKSILIPLCGFKSYCLRTSTLWKSVTSCDVAYLQGDSRIALGQMWRYGHLFDLQSVLKYNK